MKTYNLIANKHAALLYFSQFTKVNGQPFLQFIKNRMALAKIAHNKYLISQSNTKLDAEGALQVEISNLQYLRGKMRMDEKGYPYPAISVKFLPIKYKNKYSQKESIAALRKSYDEEMKTLKARFGG